MDGSAHFPNRWWFLQEKNKMESNISIIILTYNEEVNLTKCLESILNLSDDVIVVDSYSTDKTLDIAKKYGARVMQHEFKNQATQFNWALDNIEIKHEWILRLDADEVITKELEKEIVETLPRVADDISGFYIKRKVYFMGRWIKHGAYYPTWILRLFRKGRARSEEREMDEHIILLQGKPANLKNDFIDENLNKLSWWIDRYNKYSTREVSALLIHNESVSEKLDGSQTERKRWLKNNFYYRTPKFLRAFLYFVYRYFIRLGFLDGREGLMFHFLQGFWYRFLIDAKMYEQEK
jgi:glycosyltransferase involved in cell wall biosynthesis